MAKDCPDLLRMSAHKLREFWKQHEPSELKRVGDRLLAESLPTRQPRPDLVVSGEVLRQRREAASLELARVAGALGVTPELLEAWEADRIRPPESLGLIYERLASLCA